MARLIFLPPFDADASALWVNPDHIVSVANLYDKDDNWAGASVRTTRSVAPFVSSLAIDDIAAKMVGTAPND